MKKGLFSILAGALLVVGCQNYDDQFSNIESQITALASQVAGLSQVQSDLTALAGTVNSLQSSVGETVNTALAAGLADIDTAVASLEAATATAASSEDVAAIAAAVADNQTDLTDLLSQSSVFQGAVVISSVASLNAFHAMGDGLKIVANNVTFDVKTDMDMVKVQAVADVLSTITGNLKYTAATGVTTEAVFNNLTGTASLTMEQSGGYHFPVLTSATELDLSDKFETSITRVNFPALLNVNKMGTDGASTNVIEFTKATSMNFAALKYYTPGTLTFKMKRGTATEASVLNITALDDVNALAVQTALNLTISGPNTVAISQLDGKNGTLTFDTVDSVTVTDYDGGITVNDKVLTFTSNNVVTLAGTLGDVVTMDITGVLDPNNILDKSGPAIALNQDDFNVVKLKGKLESVSVDAADRLTTLWVYADVNKGNITVKNNGDLTAIDLTGSKASGVTLDNNDRLTTAVVNTTIQKSIATGATLNGTIAVTNSSDLESLTITAASVAVLTITANPLLATINATGLTSIGATAASNVVNIYGNLFTVSAATDIANAAATTAAAGAVGKVGDLGLFTTTSGFGTLKAYLTLVGANASATANVYVDIVTSVLTSAGVESLNDQTYSSTTARTIANASASQKVLVKTANTADTGDAITTTKRSYLIKPAAENLAVVINAIDIFETSVGAAQTPAASTSLAMNANATILKGQLLGTIPLALADVAGVSLAVTTGASAKSFIGFGVNSVTGQNSDTSGTGAYMMTTGSDTLKVSIDGFSATISGTQLAMGAGGYSAANILTLIENIEEQWKNNYVYSTATVKSATAVKWDLASIADGFSAALGASKTRTLQFTAKDQGTPAIGITPVVTITKGKTATGTNLGYIIGNDVSKTNSVGDDGALGTDIVLSITADTAGATLAQTGAPLATGIVAVKGIQITAATLGNTSELNSTYRPNATASAVSTLANIYPYESRVDVIAGEEANAAATSNAVDFTRVGWL